MFSANPSHGFISSLTRPLIYCRVFLLVPERVCLIVRHSMSFHLDVKAGMRRRHRVTLAACGGESSSFLDRNKSVRRLQSRWTRGDGRSCFCPGSVSRVFRSSLTCPVRRWILSGLLSVTDTWRPLLAVSAVASSAVSSSQISPSQNTCSFAGNGVLSQDLCRLSMFLPFWKNIWSVVTIQNTRNLSSATQS